MDFLGLGQDIQIPACLANRGAQFLKQSCKINQEKVMTCEADPLSQVVENEVSLPAVVTFIDGSQWYGTVRTYSAQTEKTWGFAKTEMFSIGENGDEGNYRIFPYNGMMAMDPMSSPPVGFTGKVVQ